MSESRNPSTHALENYVQDLALRLGMDHWRVRVRQGGHNNGVLSVKTSYPQDDQGVRLLSFTVPSAFLRHSPQAIRAYFVEELMQSLIDSQVRRPNVVPLARAMASCMPLLGESA